VGVAVVDVAILVVVADLGDQLSGDIIMVVTISQPGGELGPDRAGAGRPGLVRLDHDGLLAATSLPVRLKALAGVEGVLVWVPKASRIIVLMPPIMGVTLRLQNSMSKFMSMNFIGELPALCLTVSRFDIDHVCPAWGSTYLVLTFRMIEPLGLPIPLPDMRSAATDLHVELVVGRLAPVGLTDELIDLRRVTNRKAGTVGLPLVEVLDYVGLPQRRPPFG
jgi:hypothetical protein